MMPDKLGQYIALISSFVAGKIEAADFERDYLKLFKEDETQWSETEFAILDELFGDVDGFCADPQLRDEKDLDEYELKERGKMALERLQSLAFVNS
ncbi:MAG: colicin immunity domain-containing protein [candidate division KSB1 bacterium]|nr:colicin immunity domain-containing protein [candidate division KSB1 bacterium]MDZ7365364.1 colicin immunity domain-containing protein [candidate division KSB1 bacterium]MDZ7407391.1 colicin immunity domain-containing protein [candidate division KSB1 bacterium]